MRFACPPQQKKTHTSWRALMTVYKRKEDGSVTIFSIFMFVMMLAILGVSIDFMRAERNRTILQHTLDRAILAAADLDQERPAADVVEDYFEAAGLQDALAVVNVEQGLNYKTLYAEAGVETYAPWLDMLGRWDDNRVTEPGEVPVDERGLKVARAECSGTITAVETPKRDANGNIVLDADGNEIITRPSDIEMRHCLGLAEDQVGAVAERTATISAMARGGAEERVSNVEISMVLDVSGSMGSNQRMPRLKSAANTFIDTVLNDTTEGLVSVSVVPYDEHVSLGSDFYNVLRQEASIVHRHNFSHCLEFEDAAFDEVGFSFNTTYEQMQHTRLYYDWTFQCSASWQDAITVMSQNANALKAQVNAFQPSGNTHIFFGMKWAAALLEPGFNRVTQDLVSAGMVDAEFSDRPAAFDDMETLKTIVLMTDGQNTSSFRVQDWAYSQPSHYVHWNNWGIMNYLNAYVHSSYHHQYYYTKYWNSYGDALLDNICDAAKDEGIVIWSIGFEVNDHGADVMQNCASSPSHFFRVEGIEISDAFDAIARQINQLRLTQ